MDSNSQSHNKSGTRKVVYRLISLDPVELNDWVVRTSVLNNKIICMILYNVVDFSCMVRYFDDEVSAHLFLTDVVYGGDNVPEKS